MFFFAQFSRIIRGITLYPIFIYQKFFSPDHSFWAKWWFPYGYCKYSPSCSEYARQVIKKRGVVIGLAKTLWRIVRCNPWSQGGIDTPK